MCRQQFNKVVHGSAQCGAGRRGRRLHWAQLVTKDACSFDAGLPPGLNAPAIPPSRLLQKLLITARLNYGHIALRIPAGVIPNANYRADEEIV